MTPSVLIPALFCPPAGTATSPAASATELLVTTRLMAFEGKWEVHLKAFKLDYCFQSDFNILSLSLSYTLSISLFHTHTLFIMLIRVNQIIFIFIVLSLTHTRTLCVCGLCIFMFFDININF